ncbi:MAG: efflux transporter outer membrane subunit [Rubrivivax sp.]|nr:efflux transporter outer membrane subunit [Rubrivivax sp.]
MKSTRCAPAVASGALVLLSLLGGCASLQRPATPATPLPVPERWTATAAQPSAAASPAALADWWQRLGDATLNDLERRALAQATDIQVAEARLAQARSARDLAAAALRPAVGSSASVQAGKAEGAPLTRQYRAGFDAAWEADLWGRNRAGVSAAEADLHASVATLGQAQVSLAGEVAAGYIDLRNGQARLALTREALASQEHMLRITQWRAEAGLVSGLDVEQQRTTVAQTRAQIPALQGAIEQSMNALAVLTGAAPGTVHAQLATAAPLPSVPADLALAFPAAVLSQRADVAAAEARVRAALARIDAADAQRLPSLNLSGTIGLSALSAAALAPGTGVATLLAAVDWPLYDGGRVRAQVRSQEAAFDEARANHRAAVLAALKEVEDALVALRTAREQQAGQQLAAESARRAAQLAEQRYAAGLSDITGVLLAQRTLLAAEDALAGTAASVLTQHVRLYKALGGGWSPSAHASAAAAANDRSPPR